MLGGESFFQNTYQAGPNGGEVTVAPALPGDMYIAELQGESLMVQSGSYVASSEAVNVDTKWGGAKTFFASEGLIMLRVSGQGKAILSSYGAIHEINLAAGERYTIDTGHLVAFSENMGFNVRTVGGLKSTLFSGEGLVVDMTGPRSCPAPNPVHRCFPVLADPQAAQGPQQQLIKPLPRKPPGFINQRRNV